MASVNLRRLSVHDVFGLYGRILDELWDRGVVRSVNNPVGDYAEHLACAALSLTPARKSAKGFDAADRRGRKCEIKARRCTRRSKPTRFSAIRDLEGHHFDFLLVILFAEDFSVKRAGSISYAAVKRLAFRQEHVNGWILPLSDSLWSERGVTDVTMNLRKAQTRDNSRISHSS